MIGQKFNKLTIMTFSHKSSNAKNYWNCICDCGNTKVVRGSHLKNGHTKSCGCFNIEKLNERSTTHGMSKTKIYNVWSGIKQRCYYEDAKNYKYYGALGIKMCDEWGDFKNFYNWAVENGWKKGLHVCRKGDVGNYSPENCYITTAKENITSRKFNKLNIWKARVIRVMNKNHGWDNKKQVLFWGVSKGIVVDVLSNKTWVV